MAMPCNCHGGPDCCRKRTYLLESSWWPFGRTRIESPQNWWTYEVKGELPVGWICPRCRAVHAPTITACDCEPEG